MPAPDYDTLYDFESQWDTAIKAVLDPAVAMTSTPTTNLESLKTPYIAAEFNQRGVAGPSSTSQLWQEGANPDIYAEAFEGEIVLNLVTDRIKGQEVNKLRGKIRQIFSSKVQAFNETTLPWLLVVGLEETNSARDIDSEHDTDLSALTFRVVYCIRPDARPVG